MRKWARKRVYGYASALGGISFVVIALKPYDIHVNSVTVVLPMLLVILFVASLWGSRPAMFAAIVGVLCFNFFFIDPFHTFSIADTQNWVAFIAFIITAITAGQLSSYARRRADEAEARRLEIERLYEELQEAFEKASRAEALRQSEKLKSALLDAVTHDLRTPLTSIKASVTTLLNDEFKLDAEGQEEFLEIINEETDRLNRFIENMVELAKIEAGEMSLRRSFNTIDEIVSAALERGAPLTENHKIKVELEKDLPSVRVDAKALAEVFYTLIDNSAKYSPNETQITIMATRTEDEMIEFAVTDEGRGILPEMREKVFNKFFRVNAEDPHKSTGGIGLGLAIARGIIESHDGRIWIEDNPNGKGTSVKFVVPVGDE